VIVLSDLDMGMNFSITEKFKYPTRAFDRGKVLSAEDLDKLQKFARYEDVDGDGIPYRTLPGTEHDLAAYFTRGTGHTPTSAYSEDPENYEKLLLRLKKKIKNATVKDLPQPIISSSGNKVGIVAFGSTDAAIPELTALLRQQGTDTDYMRVRSLPLSATVKDFLQEHESVVVIEQNRDGQLQKIIAANFPDMAHKLKSIRVFNGLPASAEGLMRQWSELGTEAL
jgi:2-oxoglutarate ferredoxin oxidoreductase subunit alpha